MKNVIQVGFEGDFDAMIFEDEGKFTSLSELMKVSTPMEETEEKMFYVTIDGEEMIWKLILADASDDFVAGIEQSIIDQDYDDSKSRKYFILGE